MDDDPVLRSLAEELERDDPRLAAMLGEPGLAPRPRPRRRHGGTWLLAALALLAAVVLLPPGVAFGALAVLAIIGSPLLVCWLVASDEGPAPGRP